MAKKDRSNGTPVSFQIPSSGGKGPRIPIPTNQQKWKYQSGYMARPTPKEWIAAVIAFFVIVGIGFLLSVESWALTVAFCVFAMIIPVSFIQREMFFRKSRKDQAKPRR